MPKSLVVDASFTFRLILPGPHQDHLQSLVAQWLSDGYELFAPTLWAYEMTSALCKVVRFGELTPEEGKNTLALAEALGIQLVAPGNELMQRAFDWTVRLNRGSAYDSFYLALAQVLKGELWTADQRLRNAVAQPWIHYTGGQE